MVTHKHLKSEAAFGFPRRNNCQNSENRKPMNKYRNEKQLSLSASILHQLQPNGQQLTPSSGPRNLKWKKPQTSDRNASYVQRLMSASGVIPRAMQSLACLLWVMLHGRTTSPSLGWRDAGPRDSIQITPVQSLTDLTVVCPSVIPLPSSKSALADHSSWLTISTEHLPYNCKNLWINPNTVVPV